MKRTTLSGAVLYALFGIIVSCGLALSALFATLHSPWIMSRIARGFGYELSAQAVSLSPNLSGSISGLSIKRLHGNGLTLLASNVTAKNSLDMILRGEIDTLVLQNPKLTFQIGTGEGGSFDLSLLQRVPNIRLLDIQNAEAHFPFEGGQQRIEMTGIRLTVRNFSSKKGGSIAFQAAFSFLTGGETAVEASGRIKATIQLVGVYPRPYGKGTLELAIDSGKYTTGGRTIVLSGLTLATDMVYDQGSETFAITMLRGKSENFGTIEGTAKAVIRGEVPWNVNLAVASIDFSQVFAVIKPFLPEEYHAWTLQGKGTAETQLQGTYANGQPSLNGSLTFSFSQGGFSSPDSTKAAQGASGKIILKLRYAAPDEKVAFDLQSEERDGEYLWGKFYSNLSGQKASLAADGNFVFGRDPRFDLNGRLDIYQTGNYAFNLDGKSTDWVVRIHATDVSHASIVEKLLKDSLSGISPNLAHLSITGTSSLQLVLQHDGAVTTIAGTYRMVSTTLSAPEMPLTVEQIAVELPFDLVYPSSERNTPPPQTPAGLIRFVGIQGERFSTGVLQIPLTVSQNRLEIPEPIVIPFFGGHIELYGIQLDDVFSPDRNHFGVKVEGVDLGRMTQKMLGIEYPGTIDANLGMMRYENTRIGSEGKAVVRVFGGEIEATNFFAENVASASRRMGGDITFKNINLEELTKKIAIGKMTGIIRGSLRNFVMEYGQPASFTLEVESVEARGISQQISMDAIQSISVLGTGADSALNRGITQFFREYPYSKIGLRCVLTNDQFSINGTIHEEGKEYLVRRGFFRGVDVVNQNPENVISFKDMLERVERIFRPPQEAPGIEVK